MAENLITVREAANFLRISARTVYRLIESGQIGAVRIGKQGRIRTAALPGVGSGGAAHAPGSGRDRGRRFVQRPAAKRASPSLASSLAAPHASARSAARFSSSAALEPG